jgi:fermentation-respiration switch protein FrsA (DUF1100 family)
MLLASAALSCLGAILGGCDSIEKSVVFPGADSQGRPDAVIPPGGDYELVPLRTRDGTTIVAQFGRALGPAGGPAEDVKGAPTVIFFYGNGAYAAQMGAEFSRFRRLGMNVLLPEYPGYGMSGGKPSERGCYEAADAAYDYLHRRPGIDRGRIVAAGWSMGSSVAIDLAGRRKVAALVTVSAFTTLPDVARALQPWLPVSLIIRSRFDSIGKIPAVTCPILIVHGSRDEIVPPAMAAKLAAAARTRVVSYTVAGGGHNDVFAVGGDELWESVRGFISASR